MKTHVVKMAEYKVAKGNVTLKTNSLGSCVAIILYDPHTKTGGMAHIMLPLAPQKELHEIGRYANLAIPQLYQHMLSLGAQKHHLYAMMIGGAEMFGHTVKKPSLAIGLHNIHSAKQILRHLHIPILFEDIGGQRGRSVALDCETGDVQIEDYAQLGQHVSFHL